MENNFTDCELLNIYGLLVFQNKHNPKLFAERYYHWKDRIHFIDETSGSRISAGETTISEFIKLKEDWEPLKRVEFAKIQKRYSEIVQIRRDIKIEELCRKSDQ